MKIINKLVFFTIVILFSHVTFAASTPTTTTNIKRPVYTKTLLIFDLNSNIKPSFNRFIKGKNVALIIHKDGLKADNNILQSEALLTKIFNDYLLINKKSLKKIDENQDSIISSQDPQFKYLALLTYKKDKNGSIRQVIEPINSANIDKIILSGKYISLEPEKRKRNEEYVAGTVILKDGSSRQIIDIVTGQQ